MGRNGEQSGTQLPSLPSCIYLSLHPEEAGREIRLHTEQWQEKIKVSRGGGGGRQESCGWGWVWGWGSRKHKHFSTQALSLSCRLAERDLAIRTLLEKVSSVGEKQSGRLLCKGEFAK